MYLDQLMDAIMAASLAPSSVLSIVVKSSPPIGTLRISWIVISFKTMDPPSSRSCILSVSKLFTTKNPSFDADVRCSIIGEVLVRIPSTFLGGFTTFSAFLGFTGGIQQVTYLKYFALLPFPVLLVHAEGCRCFDILGETRTPLPSRVFASVSCRKEG
ncbi:hypothetical protein L6452_20087 [Arctium lappa]|uniref:Uncharacterized protein n=1 Tax=Arctium lappa TaxID=4217 RepID=A0ACB9BC94_ARCLA|nr:hypothetical protein L6452_20087 [Arctium lappa]